jgi:hypothetical protein
MIAAMNPLVSDPDQDAFAMYRIDGFFLTLSGDLLSSLLPMNFVKSISKRPPVGYSNQRIGPAACNW